MIEVKAGASDGPGAGTADSRTTFQFTDKKAATIHLAGDFNDWLENTDGKVTGHGDWLLQNDGAGNWKLTVPLAPGKHKFKYVVDGGARWETDPRLPVGTDGNSVIEVRAATSAPRNGSGVVFTYVDTSARSVSLAGEFNDWNATANPMQRDPSGLWTVALPLKPGKYQYKFVVDGSWKQDPANPDGADDTFGGKNSVKTVGP